LWQSIGVNHPGEVTKMWRKSAKLSIPRLAKLAKIDKGTISRFERGGDCRKRIFEAICKALKKTPSDAYAVLGQESTQPAPVVLFGSCSAHKELHAMLEEILHGSIASIRNIVALFIHFPLDICPTQYYNVCICCN
jgi:transcriptional regulator with XRE-family HTH domain